MNTAGDTADKFASFLLDGTEVAFKIAGSGTKNLIAIISAILSENRQTKGKTRLTNMLKSRKALKIYSFRAEDLKKFSQEAKKYGVLYSVLANKKNQKIDGIVDVMIAEEDAPKVSRIAERFKFAEVDISAIEEDIENNIPTEENKKSIEEIANEIVFNTNSKDVADEFVEDEIPSKENKSENFQLGTSSDFNKEENEQEESFNKKKSVKKELKEIQEELEKNKKSKVDILNKVKVEERK